MTSENSPQTPSPPSSQKHKAFGIIPVDSHQVKQCFEVLFCSFFGVFITVIVEIGSSFGGTNSRFESIKNVIKEFVDPIALEGIRGNIITLIILYLIALFFCYLFDANSKRNSFALGSGILSFIFQFNSLSVGKIPVDTNLYAYNTKTTKVAYLSNKTILISQSLLLKVRLQGKNREDQARIIIRNQNGTIDQNILTYDNTFDFHVPGGRYQITVEIKGYKIIDRQVEISQSRQIEEIELVRSKTPLPLQRIQRGIQQ